jgi:hypothetical protein
MVALLSVILITAWAQPPAGTLVEIAGDIPHPHSYSELEWKQLKHSSVSAANAHEKKTATYGGVRLRDLLWQEGQFLLTLFLHFKCCSAVGLIGRISCRLLTLVVYKALDFEGFRDGSIRCSNVRSGCVTWSAAQPVGREGDVSALPADRVGGDKDTPSK